MPCPLCSKEDLKPFYEDAGIDKCLNCGLVFNMSEDLLSETFYELNTYDPFKDIEKTRSRQRNFRQRIRIIDKYLEKDMILLDIGCNYGPFLSEVKDKVKKVYGIEPNVTMAKYAQDKGLNVQCGTVEQLDFPENHFDIITMFHVLEHVKDPLIVLKKISSWIKPNGLFVVEVPDIESPRSKFKREDWPLVKSEHRLYFSQNTLSSLLTKYGFTGSDIKRRDFDQYRAGIGGNVQKLGLVIRKNKKRKKKTETIAVPNNKPQKTSNSSFKKFRRALQLPIKYLLGFLVFHFNRGDYLFVIANKSIKPN